MTVSPEGVNSKWKDEKMPYNRQDNDSFETISIKNHHKGHSIKGALISL